MEKTTVKCHLTHIKTATINTHRNENMQIFNAKKLELSCTFGCNVSNTMIVENSIVGPQKKVE